MLDRHNAPDAWVVETLTRREREILALLAEGLTGPEMAVRLTLALSSVKSHLQHLYGKLGVNSKRQAVSRVVGDFDRARRGEKDAVGGAARF
jgi:ATP/maltotriose-dependent transcriptional regulator MalT